MEERMGTSGTRPDSTRACHLIRRIFEEGFAAGDASIMDQVCSPDLVEHQFGLAGTGAQARENLKAAIRDARRTLPDMSYTIEDCAAPGDTVRVRVRVRGTATGPFPAAPSSKPADITVSGQARIAGDLIAEHWEVADRFALPAQTALLDPLAAADSCPPAGG
jgi:predicted ester cyclase